MARGHKRPKVAQIFDSVKFESYQEFLDEVAKPVPTGSAWGESPSSMSTSSTFTGSDSYEHALELAREGWTEGRTNLADAIEALAPYVQAAVSLPSQSFAPAGYLPNVPMFCAGAPDCMWTTEGDDMPRAAPVVRFLVNLTAVWSVSTDAIFNRGAALCAAIEYLEASGTQCEVVGCIRTEDACNEIREHRLFECFIPIKDAGAFMEPDRMAFALAHASVLRRLSFRLMEQNDDLCGGNFGANRGIPRDVPAEFQQVYLPAMMNDRGCETSTEALKSVLTAVQVAMNPEQFVKLQSDWAGLVDVA
jgi:hypothetical protein